MKLNNKGFTLVEVVLAVLLTSFIMLGIGSLFINSMTSNRHIQNQNTSQQYAEIILAELNTTCYDASQITEISDGSGDSMNDTGEIDLHTMVISKTLTDDSLNMLPEDTAEKKYYMYDDLTRTFAVKDSSSGSYSTIASNIDGVKVIPLPKDADPPTTFETCTGIEVIIQVKTIDEGINKDADINLSTQYYFRNADFRY